MTLEGLLKHFFPNTATIYGRTLRRTISFCILYYPSIHQVMVRLPLAFYSQDDTVDSLNAN